MKYERISCFFLFIGFFLAVFRYLLCFEVTWVKSIMFFYSLIFLLSILFPLSIDSFHIFFVFFLFWLFFHHFIVIFIIFFIIFLNILGVFLLIFFYFLIRPNGSIIINCLISKMLLDAHFFDMLIKLIWIIHQLLGCVHIYKLFVVQLFFRYQTWYR